MKQIFSILFGSKNNFGPNLKYEGHSDKKSRGWIKTVLISSLFFLVSSKSFCQFNSLEHKYFNNDSIHYDVIYVSHGVLSKDTSRISKHYISLQMSKDYRNYLLKKDTVFWLERLQNEKSDWATNLILYYLYDKDASPLIIFNERRRWMHIKDDDIKYWKKFLSTSQKRS